MQQYTARYIALPESMTDECSVAGRNRRKTQERRMVGSLAKPDQMMS